MRHKYIAISGERERPATRADLEWIIRDQVQYGTVRERRRAVMARLKRGETVFDQYGFGIRLARFKGYNV